MIFYTHNFNKDLNISKKDIIIFSIIQFFDYLFLPVIIILALIFYILSELYDLLKWLFREILYIKYHFYDIRHFKGLFSWIYVNRVLRKKYPQKDNTTS